MNLIKKITLKTISKLASLIMPDALSQSGNTAVIDENSVNIDGIDKLMRQASAEGIVLLKNNRQVLPLLNKKIALFGRCQINYFYVGYGSGGNVLTKYKISPIEAILNDNQQNIILEENVLKEYQEWTSKKKNQPIDGFWGHWPMAYDEMKISDDLISISRKNTDTAVMIIGRAAGEDRDNILTKGSYYLTDIELNNLRKLRKAFNNLIIILNCGNIIDLSWDQEIKCDALLYAFLGGQEGGNGLIDVLTNKVNPCGKLPDTILKSYEKNITKHYFGNLRSNHYFEDVFVGYRYYETFSQGDVLYPFGYGLSYSKFSLDFESLSKNNDSYQMKVKIKNLGPYKGKTTAMIFIKPPITNHLAKPFKNLVAYQNSKLLNVGEEEVVTLNFTERDFASFDDIETSPNRYSFILEKGDYILYLGEDVRGCKEIITINYESNKVIETLNEICSLKEDIFVQSYIKGDDGIIKAKKLISKSKRNLKDEIIKSSPKELTNHKKRYDFQDVIEKKISLDEFVASLDDEELEALTRGHGMMSSSYGIKGNAGAFGGIIKKLNERHIPPLITADGPAGIRICRYSSLLPCGTCLAATFNNDLVEELYTLLGKEMKAYNVDILLAPGMNIHRNPLCGRNFEYFSEDPLLTGKMAAAVIRGVQNEALGACVKHFACNNQEKNRNYNDSIVSNRALREIYLRGFEIALKESSPKCVMTSYNKINGVWSHYNFDLGYTVLRKEWNYQGVVITDWWMRMAKSIEFPNIKNNAYRVRSNVDVYMPGGSRICKKYVSDGTLLPFGNDKLTRGEAQQSAKRVLNLCLDKVYLK